MKTPNNSERQEIKKLCEEYGLRLNFIDPGQGVTYTPGNVINVGVNDTIESVLLEIQTRINKQGELMLLRKEVSLG